MYLILKLLSFFFSTDATRVKRNPLSTVLRIIFAPIFFYFFCTGITKTFEIHENGISIGWKKENTQQQVSFLFRRHSRVYLKPFFQQKRTIECCGFPTDSQFCNPYLNVRDFQQKSLVTNSYCQNCIINTDLYTFQQQKNTKMSVNYK